MAYARYKHSAEEIEEEKADTLAELDKARRTAPPAAHTPHTRRTHSAKNAPPTRRPRTARAVRPRPHATHQLDACVAPRALPPPPPPMGVALVAGA